MTGDIPAQDHWAGGEVQGLGRPTGLMSMWSELELFPRGNNSASRRNYGTSPFRRGFGPVYDSYDGDSALRRGISRCD